MIPRTRTPSIFSLLFSLRGSIIPVIWPRVLYTILLSLAIVVIDEHFLHLRLSLNAAPLTLMGLTLAIFLGFRNTVAYQRWWEARSLWGELIVVTRNLARQWLAFLPQCPRQWRHQAIGELVGFTHALRHHLRGSDPDDDLTRWLDATTRSTVLSTANRPNSLLALLGQATARRLRDGGGDSILLTAMDGELSKLSHVLAGCERIQGTPIPYAYILLLHRTVHVYCFLLPFCLVGLMGWITPVVVGVIAYTFFGLDALGDQIEDPFDVMPNDLPLERYCEVVERDLMAIAQLD